MKFTDRELKALKKLLSWDRGEIKWGEVITAVEKARTKMRYQITRTFDRKNVKGQPEKSERVYVGDFLDRKEAISQTEVRFKRNEPTATNVKTTVEKVK